MNKTISLYFDSDLHEKVKRRAFQQRRTLSAHIRWLVEQDLKGAGPLPELPPSNRGHVKLEEVLDIPADAPLPVPPAFPR